MGLACSVRCHGSNCKHPGGRCRWANSRFTRNRASKDRPSSAHRIHDFVSPRSASSMLPRAISPHNIRNTTRSAYLQNCAGRCQHWFGPWLPNFRNSEQVTCSCNTAGGHTPVSEQFSLSYTQTTGMRSRICLCVRPRRASSSINWGSIAWSPCFRTSSAFWSRPDAKNVPRGGPLPLREYRSSPRGFFHATRWITSAISASLVRQSPIPSPHAAAEAPGVQTRSLCNASMATGGRPPTCCCAITTCHWSAPERESHPKWSERMAQVSNVAML